MRNRKTARPARVATLDGHVFLDLLGLARSVDTAARGAVRSAAIVLPPRIAPPGRRGERVDERVVSQLRVGGRCARAPRARSTPRRPAALLELERDLTPLAAPLGPLEHRLAAAAAILADALAPERRRLRGWVRLVLAPADDLVGGSAPRRVMAAGGRPPEHVAVILTEGRRGARLRTPLAAHLLLDGDDEDEDEDENPKDGADHGADGGGGGGGGCRWRERR